MVELLDERTPESCMSLRCDTMQSMKQRSRRNPIVPRATSEALFRSVSPEEMIDIVRTGLITGRGNAFSGDARSHLVFFGTHGVDDVLHNGEDSLRQVNSSPVFWNAFRALDADDRTIERERAHFAQYQSDYGINPPRGQAKRFSAYRKLTEKQHKARMKLLDAMYKEAARLRAHHIKTLGATSFVIELHDVPGGTLYTETDSFHQSDEVGFDREVGVSAEHIAWVSIVRDGKVVRRLPWAKFVRLLREKVTL